MRRAPNLCRDPNCSQESADKVVVEPPFVPVKAEVRADLGLSRDLRAISESSAGVIGSPHSFCVQSVKSKTNTPNQMHQETFNITPSAHRSENVIVCPLGVSVRDHCTETTNRTETATASRDEAGPQCATRTATHKPIVTESHCTTPAPRLQLRLQLSSVIDMFREYTQSIAFTDLMQPSETTAYHE